MRSRTATRCRPFVVLGALFAVVALSWPGTLDRVALARRHAEPRIKTRCKSLGIAYPPAHVYFVAYKQDRSLQVWVQTKAGNYTLFQSYPIAAMSGGLGPKRQEGDGQVPEGVYRIIGFNPYSSYHLSLHLNYPNTSDRRRSDRKHPGNEIYIHGNRVSIGCLAMTDEKIEEIYLLALAGKKNGVPVYLFPMKMEGATYASLKASHSTYKGLWGELEPIYLHLQQEHIPLLVWVDDSGKYHLR